MSDIENLPTTIRISDNKLAFCGHLARIKERRLGVYSTQKIFVREIIENVLSFLQEKIESGELSEAEILGLDE